MTADLSQNPLSGGASSRHCFFISPLGAADSEVRARADEIQTLISAAVRDAGLTVVRADQIGEPGMISEQIVRWILTSEMVFADLTGANANVYYELGVAHSAARPVVTLIDKARNLTFDTAHDRAIVIGDDGRLTFAQANLLRGQLEQFVASVMAGSYSPRNVVSDARVVADLDDDGSAGPGRDPIVGLLTKTHDDLLALTQQVEALASTTGRIESDSDVALLRAFIERFVSEHPLEPLRVRNALKDGRTSSDHDDWVESLLPGLTAGLGN